MARDWDVDEDGIVQSGPFKGSHTKPPTVHGRTERELIWHHPEPATRGPGPAHADERAYEENHPAFAVISAVRTSGGAAVLFDSDIQHQHTITVTISRASRQRDLHRDWIHGEREHLIEVEMSEAQWASFVSSINTTGVPCTLRRTETNQNVPGLLYEPRLRESMDEVRGTARRMRDRLDAALREVEEKPTKANIRSLRNALDGIESNMTFAARSLEEHAENVVQKARNDIEAMVTHRAVALGLDPRSMAFSLEGEQPRQIEAADDEDVLDEATEHDPGVAVQMDGTRQ